MNCYHFNTRNTHVFTISNSKSFQCPKVGEHVSYNGYEYTVLKIEHVFNNVGGRVSNTNIIVDLG